MPPQAAMACGPRVALPAAQPTACCRGIAKFPICASLAGGSFARQHSRQRPREAVLRSSGGAQPAQRGARPQVQQCRRAGTLVAAAEKVARVPVAERLADDDLDRWRACVQLVVDCGISEEAADLALTKAFGWRGQSYWRKQKVDEVPLPEEVEAVLAFLAEQGVGEEDIAAALTRFPEVLALPVDSQLRANVATLQSQWFVRGLALKKMLRSQPQVLGYNVDCGGDCQGDCNRCWVRF